MESKCVENDFDNGSQLKDIQSHDENKLLAYLLDGFKKIQAAKNKKIVLIIGSTGCGKSTLVNYLLGNKLVIVEKLRGDRNRFKFTLKKEYCIDIADKQENAPKIGILCESETLYAGIYDIPSSNIVYCDSAGLDDNRDKSTSLAALLNNKIAINFSSAVQSIMLVIDINELSNPKHTHMRAILKRLYGMMDGHLDELAKLWTFENEKASELPVVIAFTKAFEILENSVKSKFSKDDAIQKLIDLYHSMEKELLERKEMLKAIYYNSHGKWPDFDMLNNDEDYRVLKGQLFILNSIIEHDKRIVVPNVLDNGEARITLTQLLLDHHVPQIPKENLKVMENECNLSKLNLMMYNIEKKWSKLVKQLSSAHQRYTILEERIIPSYMLNINQSKARLEKLYTDKEANKFRNDQMLVCYKNEKERLSREIEKFNTEIDQYENTIRENEKRYSDLNTEEEIFLCRDYIIEERMRIIVSLNNTNKKLSIDKPGTPISSCQLFEGTITNRSNNSAQQHWNCTWKLYDTIAEDKRSGQFLDHEKGAMANGRYSVRYLSHTNYDGIALVSALCKRKYHPDVVAELNQIPSIIEENEKNLNVLRDQKTRLEESLKICNQNITFLNKVDINDESSQLSAINKLISNENHCLTKLIKNLEICESQLDRLEETREAHKKEFAEHIESFNLLKRLLEIVSPETATQKQFFASYQCRKVNEGVLEQDYMGAIQQEYLCAISCAIMKYPVRIISCAHTFEKEELDKWLNKCRDESWVTSCPCCRDRIDPQNDIQEEPELKARIEKFCEKIGRLDGQNAESIESEDDSLENVHNNNNL